jgi:putative SOS response-associated peptidase YedK
VPADGFYEWKMVDEKTKQPYAFRMSDDAPFAFACLWDAGRAMATIQDALGHITRTV